MTTKSVTLETRLGLMRVLDYWPLNYDDPGMIALLDMARAVTEAQEVSTETVINLHGVQESAIYAKPGRYLIVPLDTGDTE